MNNELVVARNHRLRWLTNNYIVGLLAISLAATAVTGCFALSPELQQQTDKLALEKAGLQQQIEQAYADIKEGKVDATEGLALVKTLTTEIADINTRINEIAASTGASKAKVAGIVLFNLVLIALGGKQFLTYKNAVMGMVRAVHSVRENKGTVENLVSCVKNLDNKALDKAAAQMPKLKKRKKP